MNLLNVKSISILLFWVFILYGCADVNERVDQIKNDVEIINASKHHIKSYPYNNRCGVEEATISLFYWNGEIQKITDIGIGDSDKAASNWNYHYYYKNGKLIFSYEDILSFDDQKGEEIADTTRQYFEADSLIKEIKNGKITYPKNVVINTKDIRYLLKEIKKSSDIKEIYTCSEL